MGLENGFNVQAALSELAPTAAEATQLRGTNFIPVVSQMVEDLGGEV
ncbi:MAG: hypothetical protein ACE5DX_06120 [Candidatus Dojkabacteria bacterium]